MLCCMNGIDTTTWLNSCQRTCCDDTARPVGNAVTMHLWLYTSMLDSMQKQDLHRTYLDCMYMVVVITIITAADASGTVIMVTCLTADGVLSRKAPYLWNSCHADVSDCRWCPVKEAPYILREKEDDLKMAADDLSKLTSDIMPIGTVREFQVSRPISNGMLLANCAHCKSGDMHAAPLKQQH